MPVIVFILVALLVLPLAARRNDSKRLLLIAVGLEAIKHFLILILRHIDSEFFSSLFVVIFYVWMFPQMIAVGEFGPDNIWSRIGMICIGVICNLIPACYISILLPDKNGVSSVKQA
jgi:hypothetical protein